MSFMRVGLAPDFGAYYTLPRVVGVQRAKELMLSAREVGADEAKQLGIVMEIHPADALLARAQALAASFVNASPTAVSLIKRALAGGSHAELQSAFESEAAEPPRGAAPCRAKGKWSSSPARAAASGATSRSRWRATAPRWWSTTSAHR